MYNKIEPFKKRFKFNGEYSQSMKQNKKNRTFLFRPVVTRALGMKLEASS